MRHSLTIFALTALFAAACGRTAPFSPGSTLGEGSSGATNGGAAVSPDAGPPPPEARPPPDAGAPTDAGAPCRISFGSSADWTVYAPGSSGALGSAQAVCLSPGEPTGCPAGAFSYDYGAGWMAEPSNLDGALWVWAPGIAVTDSANAAHYVFQRDFTLSGPAEGTIQIGGDDYAEVRVNGAWVGAVGSTSDWNTAAVAHSQLTEFALPGLTAGTNTITVDAQNGDWTWMCNPCSYQQNPAGVVFGGEIDCQ